MSGLAELRQQLHARRMSLAEAAAEPLIAGLVGFAAARSDPDLEEELCVRIGRALAELDEGPIKDHVNPIAFAEAVIDAAGKAVGAALVEKAIGWTHAWRVLTAVTGTVPYPLSEQAAESIDDLRAGPGGRLLPKTPAGPTVTGSVLWTRDGYGSRFGVAAPIRTAEGPDRWYLWDIDACGHDAFTVHSRYHATPDEALADWQAGVGAPAADGTAFAPVDDMALLDELMPRERHILRPGGQNVEQFAEYHRSQRLAEAVIDTIEPHRAHRTAVQADLDPKTAAADFAAWLREHPPARTGLADRDELPEELADSWQSGGPADLYSTCSPHRVALAVAHIRDYYQQDFAAELVALLPEWAAWLADRGATPAHAADRCQIYTHGELHPGVGADVMRPTYLARVAE